MPCTSTADARAKLMNDERSRKDFKSLLYGDESMISQGRAQRPVLAAAQTLPSSGRTLAYDVSALSNV